MTTFIDIHALHPVAPSNLNRDENGSPKTATVGGTRRHRVSSQAWKRVVRSYFNAHDKTGNLGYRTKNVANLILAELHNHEHEFTEEELQEKTVEALKAAGFIGANTKKKEGQEAQTDALAFVSQNQIRQLAKKILAGADAKDIKAALKEGNSIDLALFGRMIASDPTMSVEGASLIAHAVSTHAIDTEFDFFTAVDDFNTTDHAGAGMVGDIEFTSSTLYRFASVNVDHLQTNLGGDDALLATAVEQFIEAFIKTTPNGKQTTFATPTLPTVVLVSIRQTGALSYAGAFDRSVQASEDGYDIASTKQLVKYIQNINEAYGDDAPKYAVALTEETRNEVQKVAGLRTLPELLAEVRATVEGV